MYDGIQLWFIASNSHVCRPNGVVRVGVIT